MGKDQILDCRELACPQPVIKTKDALLALQPGTSLLVRVDNEAARDNVRRFAESQKHLVQVKQIGTEYQVRIVRGAEETVPGQDPEVACEAPPQAGMVVYISSATMGKGDDELGASLMTAYLDTLSHFAKDISHIILINGGVRLAVEGSPCLDHLQELAGTGIELLVCGTCLNHFKLQGQLGVGSVSNMFTILETLSRASRVLSP